ncbi:SEL1-like repeat protein [Zavarzinia aquatilis]|uniref:Sel1 repeat family protein n=1 Tax=Zavarzinia aquatilis TaxID=2211142 RepID=A0A317DTB1_9PROT|nr:tetratricopeptide repeat protein [Zavarzinia aquatilis]PWR17928.1 hypothetical protein DKG74_20185 [Zavarzinia aquatilis]
MMHFMRGLAVLAVSVFCGAAGAWADGADCDALAASPYDSRRPPGVPGVRFAAMDVAKAEAACRQAVAAYPGEFRFKYNLARVLWQENKKGAEAARLMREAAGTYPAAMTDLGVFYELGFGVEKNDVTAMMWHRKAAEAGDVIGMFSLSTGYQEGRGVPKDMQRALEWLGRAADKGLADASYGLAFIYQQGVDVPRDMTQAIKHYQDAVAAGFPAAMVNLGKIYYEGDGVPIDRAAGMRLLRQAAETGIPRGQAALAHALFSSDKEADWREAKIWAEKARAAGDPHGTFVLALLYSHGKGVPKDSAKARELVRAAAEMGHPYAMYTYGVMLLRSKDYVGAASMVGKSAEAGQPEAMFLLANLVGQGIGTPQNEEASLKWLTKAADAGYQLAKGQLGLIRAGGGLRSSPGATAEDISRRAREILAMVDGYNAVGTDRDEFARDWQKVEDFFATLNSGGMDEANRSIAEELRAIVLHADIAGMDPARGLKMRELVLGIVDDLMAGNRTAEAARKTQELRDLVTD